MSEFKKSPDVTVEGFRKLYLPNFCIIDSEVRKDKSLSGDEKIFFGELNVLASERGYCWGTDEEFAELKEVSVRTLQRYLINLEKSGFIKRQTVSVTYRNENGDIRWKKDRKIWINNMKFKKFANTTDLAGSIEHDKCGGILKVKEKENNNNKEAKPKTPTAVVVPSHKEIILEPAIEKTHAEIISKPAVEKNHKEKLLERTKLTAPEQMGIKTKFGHLSDDVFTEAIEAFFEYERKNGSENYIALLKSALGANEYKKPWTKNQAVQTAQDKELERKKHEDKIFFRKYRVKAMQDKYETNKYFTRKDGHIINFKIGEKFCEYQMRDMVRYAMIIYDSDNFEKEIDALEKEIEKRINAEKK